MNTVEINNYLVELLLNKTKETSELGLRALEVIKVGSLLYFWGRRKPVMSIETVSNTFWLKEKIITDVGCLQ